MFSAFQHAKYIVSLWRGYRDLRKQRFWQFFAVNIFNAFSWWKYYSTANFLPRALMQLCTPDISVSDALCVFCIRIIAAHISVLNTLGAFCNWRVSTRRRLWGSQISVLDKDEHTSKKIHFFDKIIEIISLSNSYSETMDLLFVLSTHLPRGDLSLA